MSLLRIKCFLFILTLLCTSKWMNAQIGYGITAKTDIYQRFSNPIDGNDSRSTGSALLNLGLGPKIWLGKENVSFSAEASAMISPFAFSLSEFKGLGATSFPLLAKLNFGGLSGLNKQGKMGFSIGGGIQWAKTELFGLKEEFSTQGANRSMFKTYVVEAAVGFGLSGFNIQGFIRYGKNSDTKANTFNFGVAYDFNLPTLKELTDPEF